MTILQSELNMTRADQAVRGLLPGSIGFSAYGEKVFTEEQTNHAVWPGGPLFGIPPVEGISDATIQSTSENDSDGGTGINTLRIRYIDENLEIHYADVTLNGTTAVNLNFTFRFINCIHILTVGSNGSADGDLTVTSDGTIYSIVKEGETTCDSSARMVPKGKRLIITDMVGGTISSTADSTAKIRFSTTEVLGYKSHDIFYDHAGVGLQNGSETLSPKSTPIFTEGTIIGMFASVSKACTITASWFGYFENASS